MRIWISQTFVFVGPVFMSPSVFSKKWYESLFLRYFSGFSDFLIVSVITFSETIAPAASVGPSFPSVATETNHMLLFLFFVLRFLKYSQRKESAISWFLPPFPFPLIVTVVSPPARTHPGFWTGMSYFSMSSEIPVKTLATSEASPIRWALKRRVLYPRDLAFCSHALTAVLFEPIIKFQIFENAGCSSPGVSGILPSAPAFSNESTLLGISLSISYLWMISRASL